MPSKAGDASFLKWLAKVERSVMSPSAAEANTRTSTAIDARAALPAIRVPTLVLHVAASPVVPIEFGRHIASHIEELISSNCPGLTPLRTGSIPIWLYRGWRSS